MADQRIWPPASPPPAPQDPPRNLRDKIIQALRQIFDPEIPVNVYDLGLIYNLDIDERTHDVAVEMTLTTPNCPEAELIPQRVRQQIELIPEVGQAEVNVVWDPPWDRSMMTEEARLILGLD